MSYKKLNLEFLCSKMFTTISVTYPMTSIVLDFWCSQSTNSEAFASAITVPLPKHYGV